MFELNDKKIVAMFCSKCLSGPLKIAYFLHIFVMIRVHALRVQINVFSSQTLLNCWIFYQIIIAFVCITVSKCYTFFYKQCRSRSAGF